MVCVGAKGGVSGPAGGRADDRSFAHQLGIAHSVILGEDFRINQPLFTGFMHGLNSLPVLLRCGEEDGLAILNGHIVCVVAADIGSEGKSVEVDRVSIAFPIGNLVVAALKKGIHWKALGFTQVLSAYQVEAARRILLTEKIDLLLSDIDMPGGSGLDLLRWMRGENDMPLCIFLTNYADFAYAQEAEDFDRLAEFCHSHLSELAQGGKLCSRTVPNLQTDVVQLLYAYLEGRGIRAHQLFAGETYRTIAACASDRAEDLEMYFHYLFSVDQEGLKLISSEKSIAARVREYVDEHYQEDIGRESLEEILYFDPDYTSRLFKKEMGVSFMTYVIQKRIREARRLLAHTNQPINRIAARVGYENYSYFTRLFKRVGMTPAEYRAMKRSDRG